MTQTDWVPERLGRYDVIGELATGGMAQILLAKPSEPGGFHNLVVLKRILPHLADDKNFVQMFLDEARIVAALDHPNVVHVHELDEGPDGRFMVMEFLDGESLFGMMRRLTRLKREIGHDIALHVVAEACSGLHAAHELRDEQGRLLELVHRDISPHNLLLTYSGKLKVIDFGIAKTEHRITRTETGQLKGKFEYMSPEQCAAQPVDRRSDVYALGIILYELVTGRRLFKRANELLTIKAVTEQPVIPPTELNPSCSPQVEAICMRALARKPDERFQTCAEMRRALLKVLREAHRSPKLPEDQLRDLMQDIFADRIAEKLEIMERIQRGDPPAKLPKPEVDLQYAFPEISDDFLQAHTHTRKAGVTATVNVRRPTGSGTPVSSPGQSSPGHSSPGQSSPGHSSPGHSSPGHSSPGHSSPGHSSSGAAAAHASPPAGTLTPAGAAPPAASAPAAAAPVAAPAAGSAAAPPAKLSRRTHLATAVGVACGVVAVGVLLLLLLDQPEEQVVPVGPEPSVATPAGGSSTNANVTLRISSQPPGAAVLLDGAQAGTTPVSLAVPRSGVGLSYELRMPGYITHRGTLVPVSDMPLDVVLQPAPVTAPDGQGAEDDAADPNEGARARARREARREARRARREAEREAARQAPAPAPPAPARNDDPFHRFE